MDQVVLDPDYDAELRHIVGPRPMPAILQKDDYDLWLDPGMTNVEAISDLLKPFDARSMCSYAVSSRVNHVANDDAECSTKVELAAPPQGQLFC